MHARAVAAATTVLLGAMVSSPTAEVLAAGGHERPLIVGHRGAAAYAPENTLASVDKAAALGFRWVENDVQRARDGELVVLHDDSLRRTTNVEQVFPGRAPWKVKDFTAAEISRLDAGSWFSPAYAGTRVPTLKQYLRRVEQRHEKLLLEVKNPELYPGVERQILKLLGNEGWLDRRHLTDRLIVQSFSADSVRTVHQLDPAVTTAFLGRPATADLRRFAGFADLINPSWTTLTPEYVSRVHAVPGPHGRPLRVFTWTVDDAPRARTVSGYGVDGIISDKPDVVRASLDAP
ncbi:glycerophosphodiester phosphodiesterase family protein [Streptomyces sp. NPDC021356]|uniref:glycerophosphodiester phosphodiesterase n=1 Tax=Streptomyces sp. NPDC021356 TaxID=3154900 RepID=UPI0033DE068E